MAEASRTVTGYSVPAEAHLREIYLLKPVPADEVDPSILPSSVVQQTLECDSTGTLTENVLLWLHGL